MLPLVNVDPKCHKLGISKLYHYLLDHNNEFNDLCRDFLFDKFIMCIQIGLKNDTLKSFVLVTYQKRTLKSHLSSFNRLAH